MSTAADLVIVSSPLQYMNAVEQRRGAPADLVLIGDRHGGDEVIEALKGRHAPLWRRTILHPRRPRPSGPLPAFARDLIDAAYRRSLKKLAASLPGERYRTIVFGDYRNVSHRLLVDFVPHENLVLLDDGSVTPQSAAFRAAPERAPEPKQFDLSWFRTGVAKSLFGDLALPEPSRLTFFTIYGRLVEQALARGDDFVGNDFSVWRGIAGEKPRGDEIWMLGADHAPAGICSAEDYRALVTAAASALRGAGGGRIVYWPHRGEDREAAGALATSAGMTLGASRMPIEIDYLDAENRPALVVVLASSAADTLSVIDPDLAIARVALPDGYLRRRSEHILAVVAAHDRFNPRIRVIAPSTEPQ